MIIIHTHCGTVWLLALIQTLSLRIKLNSPNKSAVLSTHLALSVSIEIELWSFTNLNLDIRLMYYGSGIAQPVVCLARCPTWCIIHSLWVQSSSELRVERILSLESTWVQTPFPQNSCRWEYEWRSSLCPHAFRRMDSKDPDIHVLDGWMLATKTHPAYTIHKDRMWLPQWLD